MTKSELLAANRELLRANEVFRGELAKLSQRVALAQRDESALVEILADVVFAAAPGTGSMEQVRAALHQWNGGIWACRSCGQDLPE